MTVIPRPTYLSQLIFRKKGNTTQHNAVRSSKCVKTASQLQPPPCCCHTQSSKQSDGRSNFAKQIHQHEKKKNPSNFVYEVQLVITIIFLVPKNTKTLSNYDFVNKMLGNLVHIIRISENVAPFSRKAT